MLFGRVKKSKKVTLESLGGRLWRNMAPKSGPKRLPKTTKNPERPQEAPKNGPRDPKRPSGYQKVSKNGFKMVQKFFQHRLQILIFFMAGNFCRSAKLILWTSSRFGRTPGFKVHVLLICRSAFSKGPAAEA